MTNKFYATEPTDWVTALDKIYAKQSEQLKRWYDQQRTRDQQMVTKAENENIAKVFGSVAGFSSTVSKAVKANEVRQEKKDSEYRNELSNTFSLNPELSEGFIKSVSEYDGDRNDIWKDSKFFDPLLASLSEKSNEAAQAILKQDPRRMIIFQETLARQFSNQLPFLAQKWVADEKAKDPEKWEKFSNEQEITKINEYKTDQLVKFGISEKAAKAILSGELKRQTETIRGTRTASTNDKLFKQNHALLLSTLKIAGGTVDVKALPQAVHEAIILTAGKDFRHIKDGDTRLQRATESVVSDLIHLSKNSFIPNGAFAGLEDYEFPHPAGKDGKASVIDAFFAKDSKHFSLLTKSLDEGQNGVLDVQTQIDQTRLSELKAKASQVGLNDEETDELNVIANRGLLPDKSITDVRDISVDANTPEAYKIVKQSYKDRGILSSGNLIAHEAEIKLEKNDDFRNEQLDRIKHHKERRRELGYPTDDEKFVRDRIAKAFNLTLGDDEDLSGKLYDLQIHLVQKLRKEFQNQIEDPNGEPIIDRHSWTLTNDAFEQYVVNKGIDVPASTNPNKPNNGEGIFSATGEGKMNNFKLFQDERISAIKENRSRLNDTNIELYDKNLNTAYKNAKNNKNVVGETVRDRVLNTAESVLTKEDILGFFSEGLSGEILLKARRMGITPSTLVKRQYEALKLVNKDYLTRHGIDNVEFEQPDETIHDILKNNDKTLAYVFTNTTPSPKQTARIIAAVKKIDKKDTIYKQVARAKKLAEQKLNEKSNGE